MMLVVVSGWCGLRQGLAAVAVIKLLLATQVQGTLQRLVVQVDGWFLYQTKSLRLPNCYPLCLVAVEFIKCGLLHLTHKAHQAG